MLPAVRVPRRGEMLRGLILLPLLLNPFHQGDTGKLTGINPFAPRYWEQASAQLLQLPSTWTMVTPVARTTVKKEVIERHDCV